MRLRTHFSVAVLALVVAAWPVGALAGNPHGGPPGQDKGSNRSGHAHAHGKAHLHGSGHAHANGHLEAQVKTHGHVHARAGADVTGHAHASANSNAAVNARATITFAAAGSAQTKLYGNGKTAGEIAMENGAQADTMLYGPGNSRPHKISCGGHWVDVHTLKAHAGACAGAMGSAGASVEAKVYGNGMTAAQIVLQAGFGGGILVGAGNSGLHKVACGAHLIDVHALKAHAGACAGAGARGNAGVTGTDQVSAGASGQTHGAAQAHASAGAKAGGGVLGASSTSPGRRSTASSGLLGASTGTGGTLPFTGLQLSLAALIALSLIAGGLGLRRAAQTRA